MRALSVDDCCWLSTWAADELVRRLIRERSFEFLSACFRKDDFFGANKIYSVSQQTVRKTRLKKKLLNALSKKCKS